MKGKTSPGKGMSAEECVKRAEKIISEKGICLLLFDAVNSTGSKNRKALNLRLSEFMEDANSKFREYFPEHNLAAAARTERGFRYLLGDSSWTGINSARAIHEIIDYQIRNYPDLPLYWGVAEDGYDDMAARIAK